MWVAAQHGSSQVAQITDDLVCHACHAVVLEVVKQLPPRHRRRESDIFAATDALCSKDLFRTYKYPPPAMARGCEAFFDRFEGDFEMLVLRHPEDNAMTTACVPRSGNGIWMSRNP